MIKAIIFDMDGTLLNTLDDLHASMNYTLEMLGYPTITLDQTRAYVGNGAKKLVERALGSAQNEETFDRCFRIFTEHYDAHKNDRTAPYEGICALLGELKLVGYRMAVVSNKYDVAVKSLAKDLFGGLLEVAIGESARIAPKPAPQGVWEAVRLLEASVEECVYVGDSEVDALTAENSGLKFVGVTWGFRSRETLIAHGAEYLIDTPGEMIALLERL